MYWQKETETMGRKEFETFQLEKLIETAANVNLNVGFYKNKFKEINLKPADIKSVRDIRKLPFTTKEDLRANYPCGLLAAPLDKAIRLHTSSGTTGKPKAIFFSKKDIETAANNIARCLIMTGIRKNDVLQNMMTYGLFTGAFMIHYGAELVGALVIPAGPGNTERQIALMRDFKTTAIHLTPSYALYLADVLEKKGINPKKDFNLKTAYMGAEPYTEETKNKIESAFGIDVYNCYGLSEMNGPGVAFECPHKDGMHIWEDNYIVEILDSATGEPAEEGEYGELVLTTLRREAMPILRYRTGDITKFMPGKCKCGRTHRKIARIHGRTDDMFIVRGVNIFPQQVERILMGIKGVGRNYQIVLDSYDRMTVKVELSKNVFDGNVEHLENLQNKILAALKSEIIISPKVEILEPGILPISEGKAKRVIDNRNL